MGTSEVNYHCVQTKLWWVVMIVRSGLHICRAIRALIAGDKAPYTKYYYHYTIHYGTSTGPPEVYMYCS